MVSKEPSRPRARTQHGPGAMGFEKGQFWTSGSTPDNEKNTQWKSPTLTLSKDERVTCRSKGYSVTSVSGVLPTFASTSSLCPRPFLPRTLTVGLKIIATVMTTGKKSHNSVLVIKQFHCESYVETCENTYQRLCAPQPFWRQWNFVVRPEHLCSHVSRSECVLQIKSMFNNKGKDSIKWARTCT